MTAILFDLNGVFYIGKKAIQGTRSTLEWIKEKGIPFCFLTNTSKLRGFAIEATPESILTPSVIAAQAYGFKGILKQTGKFHPSDLKHEIHPDATINSMTELPERWTTPFRQAFYSFS
jgi:ribonucleotide monophosphatase NagD (HAD superfamily)